MTNQVSVRQHQQQALEMQERDLQEIDVALDQVNDSAKAIGQELDEQQELIDELNKVRTALYLFVCILLFVSFCLYVCEHVESLPCTDQ